MKAIWISALSALLLAAMAGCSGQEEWPPESDRVRPQAQVISQTLENAPEQSATLSKQSNGMSAGLFLFSLKLNEPMTLQIDVETTSGWLDMALKDPGGKKVFDQDKLRGAYEVEIQEVGTYQVILSAGDYHGRFAFTGPYPGAITTMSGGTDLNEVFDPPEPPPIPPLEPLEIEEPSESDQPATVDSATLTKHDNSMYAKGLLFELEFKEPMKLRMDVETTSGRLDMKLKDPDGKEVFSQQRVRGTYEVQIENAGTYQVILDADYHTGSISFTGPYPGAILTEDGGTDLDAVFAPTPPTPPTPPQPPVSAVSGGKTETGLDPVTIDTKEDTGTRSYTFTLDKETKFKFFGDTEKGMISVLLRNGPDQKVYEGSSLGALEAQIDLFPGDYGVTVNTVSHTGYFTIETE